MKKRWKAGILVLLIVAVGGVLTLAYSKKKTEIVWYLTEPEYFGVERDEMEPYQEVHAKRFELFNKRLKALGIPARVVFKYAPTQYEAAEEELMDDSWYSQDILFSGEKLKELIQHDPKADIAEFSTMEYELFLPLDTYMENEEMKLAIEALPEKVWEVNRIKGKTYQIPRGNATVKGTVYAFHKSFFDKYQIPLEEEKLKKMTPEEIIEWLLPYFEENRLLNDAYYLTEAPYLNFSDYFINEHIPVLEGTMNNVYLNLNEKQVADGFSMEEMKKYLDLYQYIYENNLDAHENRQSMSASPVFTMQNIPSIKELQGVIGEDNLWQEFQLENAYITRSLGNGVLSSSENQELAVQVLAASVYDEELSNIMIYGVPEEDYTLTDGHAVYKSQKGISCMGTFSAIGNNMIAYPNELEVMDKKEKTWKLMQDTPLIPYSNFVPDWNEDLLKKMSEIAAVYQETIHMIEFSEVPDLDTYLTEQQKKLEDAGLKEVISELQKQVDNWEE